MDYSETLEQLNITLGDTEDTTFTPEEKARALQKAWNDSYVVNQVVDSTLTFTKGTVSQAIPATLTTVTGISLSPSNSLTSDFPELIGTDNYDIVDGNIRWKNRANSIIPDTYTLYLIGNKKLDWNTDTLDTVNLQEYVLALAGYNTLSLLGYKKANLFLKNDLSMAELISLRRELKQEAMEYRAKLQRSFEGA